MLHKKASTQNYPVASTHSHILSGLSLVTRTTRQPVEEPGSLLDLVPIVSRRCAAFFAEAAVLVLVFGILDYFMLKGRVELGWILGALAISVGLLAASIAMDFGAHRWIGVHGHASAQARLGAQP